MSELLEKIKSQGHWHVLIRPLPFKKDRISDISELYPILQKTSVKIRGWDFPHLDPHIQPQVDIDWVGQESEWQEFLEIWRFYKSGQFVDYSGMWQDNYTQNRELSTSSYIKQKPKLSLGIGDTIFRFTEIFEFASRLAMTEAGGNMINIEITVANLKNRVLWVDSPNRMPLFHDFTATIDKLPYSTKISRTELIAAPRELALKPAIELFKRFNWDPNYKTLRDYQKGLLST